VYAKCVPPEGGHDREEIAQLKLDDETPNVKLKKSPRRRQSQLNTTTQDSHETTSVPSPSSPSKSPSPSGAVTKNMNDLRYFNSSQNIDWVEVLTNFYNYMKMPGKVNGISTILKTWAGKEEEMLGSLIEKYEKQIPKKLMKYLQHVMNLLETKTESSFHHKGGNRRGIEI
jgi:hypothetical protein